jgi:hypothetical protein
MQKILYLSIAFALFSNASKAQYPDPGSKSFTFAFNPFSNFGVSPGASHTGTLLFKYYKTSDLAFRASASILYSNQSSTYDNGGSKTVNSNLTTNYALGLGLQKNIAAIDKFSVYGGADLSFGLGMNKNTNRMDIYDNTKPGTSGQNGDYTENINTTNNPLSINLYPFLGMNYFLTKYISVGTEFSMGLGYTFPGTGTRITNQRSNGVDRLQVFYNVSNSSTFSVNPNASAMVTVSVFW